MGNIELDERTAARVQEIIKQKDNHIAEFKKQVELQLANICQTVLDVKGIEGQYQLSQDGTSLVQQLEADAV